MLSSQQPGKRMKRSYGEDISRDMEEEWKNIYTMLNCIMGMVEKTKRALAILQHRSFEYASINSLPIWTPPGTTLRNRLNVPPPPLDPSSHSGLDVHELRISREPLLTTIHFAKSPNHPSEVDRAMASAAAQAAADSARRTRLTGNNHFEVVNDAKRQAVVELHKAMTAAESKASEIVNAERAKMERMLSEARRQAAEDAIAVMNHQEDSDENCWNCGRKASETCSGCNIARYCGSFCQHKDWEGHHKVCGSSSHRESGSIMNGHHVNVTSSRSEANSSPSASLPTTTMDLKKSKESNNLSSNDSNSNGSRSSPIGNGVSVINGDVCELSE
ncbi:protein CBFA2T3 [Tetranychus urticae]|nr:protein CBFA2T3 [Tetranychus urticae]XP_015781211.1 protein CBFA2T3 [Tetranychus urticae]